MKTIVTAYFKNGDTITTRINTDARGAIDYYYKKTFNLGDGAGGDNMQRCVAVRTKPAEENQ
jgi:hypothetical protein